MDSENGTKTNAIACLSQKKKSAKRNLKSVLELPNGMRKSANASANAMNIARMIPLKINCIADVSVSKTHANIVRKVGLAEKKTMKWSAL